MNGKGNNELVGEDPAGGLGGEKLTSLKEDILKELESRVLLSCSSCQVNPSILLLSSPLLLLKHLRCSGLRLSPIFDLF